MLVRALDHRCAGTAEHDGWVAVELHLVHENARSGLDDALQHGALADGVLGKELEAELEAVGDDALVLADANDDAQSPAARLPCRWRPS